MDSPDLPILDDDATDASRRAFVKTACCSTLLLSLGLGLTACDSGGAGDDGEDQPPPPGSGITINGNVVTLDLTGSQASRVATAGGFLLISSARTLVLNVDGNTIRAFTSVCTHQGCDVDRFANNRFHCPCHGSQYDVNGNVVNGPAPSPLRAFAVERSGNIVTITKT